MTDNPNPDDLDELAEWAERGEFHPDATAEGRVSRAGDAAGRALLEAAGVDVDAVEKAVGGRPRLDPNARRGKTSPRINVVVTDAMIIRLDQVARERGVKTSTIVREALETYLKALAAAARVFEAAAEGPTPIPAQARTGEPGSTRRPGRVEASA